MNIEESLTLAHDCPESGFSCPGCDERENLNYNICLDHYVCGACGLVSTVNEVVEHSRELRGKMEARTLQIAQVCHEANRAFCRTIGDYTQESWEGAFQWQRDSAIKGVEFAIANPNADASAQHESWVADKIAAGWVYGPEKDPEAKTHPCIIPYDGLPVEQRLKDHLFRNIVKALTEAA